MRDVRVVLRREYVSRVRSRWFVVTTLAAPFLMIAAVLVPAWIAQRQAEGSRLVAVLDRTGALEERVSRKLAERGFIVRAAPTGDAAPGAAAEDELRDRLVEGGISAYLVLDEETLASGRASLRALSPPSALDRLALRGAVIEAALEARLGEEEGGSGLLGGGSLDVTVLGGGRGLDDVAVASAWVGSFVLYMVVLLYAVAVMRSVLEEKTSRVVEVVVSAVRPWHLMLGKILGVGAVGLTQLAVWATVGGLLLGVALPAVLAGRPELQGLGDPGAVVPGPGFLALFMVFFLGGYFIYSGLYAAVGAMCNTDEEAQQAQLPLVALLVPPILLLMPVLDRPESALSVGLSLFPFFSPVLMFARAAGGAAPAWQVALSVVLMAATVVAVAWVAGRVYRVGILMTGKRPTPRELLRWIREA